MSIMKKSNTTNKNKEPKQQSTKEVMKQPLKFEHVTGTVVCNEDDGVVEVARILRSQQARHLLVLTKKKQPVGVISTVDICNRVVAELRDPTQLHAKDIMTKTIETINTHTSLPEALEKMAAKNISFLPVVDDKGCLAGVVEFANLLKAMAKLEKECSK